MGCFVELLGMLINLLLLILLIVVIMSVKSKREEASRHPKNAAQRELADDVIAAIERAAPDLEKAIITYNAPGSCYRGGGVHFKSQRGYLFEYDVLSHGYSALSPDAAGFVANKIAEHFGGCREVRNDRDGDCFKVWIRKEESRTKADIADICV